MRIKINEMTDKINELYRDKYIDNEMYKLMLNIDSVVKDKNYNGENLINTLELSNNYFNEKRRLGFELEEFIFNDNNSKLTDVDIKHIRLDLAIGLVKVINIIDTVVIYKDCNRIGTKKELQNLIKYYLRYDVLQEINENSILAGFKHHFLKTKDKTLYRFDSADKVFCRYVNKNELIESLKEAINMIGKQSNASKVNEGVKSFSEIFGVALLKYASIGGNKVKFIVLKNVPVNSVRLLDGSIISMQKLLSNIGAGEVTRNEYESKSIHEKVEYCLSLYNEEQNDFNKFLSEGKLVKSNEGEVASIKYFASSKSDREVIVTNENSFGEIKEIILEDEELVLLLLVYFDIIVRISKNNTSNIEEILNEYDGEVIFSEAANICIDASEEYKNELKKCKCNTSKEICLNCLKNKNALKKVNDLLQIIIKAFSKKRDKAFSIINRIDFEIELRLMIERKKYVIYDEKNTSEIINILKKIINNSIRILSEEQNGKTEVYK